MAVDACIKQVMSGRLEDDDDDDKPLAFRRMAASKQTQSNPTIKKPSSHDGQSGRQVSKREMSNRPDDDDDDEPLVFRRMASSKQTHSNSEINKSSSQRHDGQSGRQVSKREMSNRLDDDDNDEPLVFKRMASSKQTQSNSESNKSSSQRHDGQSGRQVSKRDMSNRLDDDDNDVPLVFKRMASSKQTQSNSEINKSSSQRHDEQSGRQVSKRDMSNRLDDDDKDEPLVFKRMASSKQTQLNSEINKSSSQRHDGQSGRQISKIYSRNGQSSSAQKGSKTAPFAKASPPIRPPVVSPKASTPSTMTSPVRSPMVNSKASVSLDNQSKQNKFTTVKEEKHSIKLSNSDDEDSEDNKPLSARIKGNSNHANTGLRSPSSHPLPSSKPKISPKDSPEDSDDEKPLSSRFPFKSSAGTSGNKPLSYDEKKSLASKLQQNGSTIRDGQGRSSTAPSKRPLDKANYSNQLVKKQKVLESSESAKVMQVSVKAVAKAKADDDDEDDIPIAQRMNKSVKSDNKASFTKPKVKKVISFKKTTKKNKKTLRNLKYKSRKFSPSSGDGQRKWTTLVHNGVIFPPPYNPHGIKMLYNGKPVDLTPEKEEVATMYAVMKDTDYMQKDKFKENFWNDWRKILGKNHVIQSLEGCDFTPIYDWYQTEKEKKKQMSSEEKKALKEEKLKQEEKYTWAIVDGVKEKVGNFRVEPPGLFRGRGEHPKMGKLKRRIRPGDITINIGKDAPVPECPIPGERWKEVRHDNTVTWLAFWNDPINPKEFKYVFLAASSSLKGQSDKEKYEKARMLKGYIENIRTAYTKNFTSKDISKRQIAVATYLIDKLALRAGNEKDDDEADTVGCCTLKIENVTPLPDSNKLEFNFLGKDSIRYENVVEVEPLVYQAILKFQAGKREGDDLFDELDTSRLNSHLKELMPGLTAKVFRTYNASITLDDMLFSETKDGDVADKTAVYNYANKQVAIICNHQRSISKSHATQMTKLEEKLNDLKSNLKEIKIDLERAKKGKPPLKGADGKPKKNLNPEALEKKLAQINVKIEKTERDMKTKEDLKTVALGTSKINYLDPRITVAWCKRHEVPIEKMFNKSLLAKFAWAMDVEPDFRF